MRPCRVTLNVSFRLPAASVRLIEPTAKAALPGRSRRIGLFVDGLIAEGRVRPFAGRFEPWPVTPLDDTPAAAQEMRHRLGF